MHQRHKVLKCALSKFTPTRMKRKKENERRAVDSEEEKYVGTYVQTLCKALHRENGRPLY